MAFPTTISTSGGDFGGCKPVISSGGNVYVLTVDSTASAKLAMFKATDPTSSFSAVGTNPTVTSGNPIQVVQVYQVGDNLHVATADWGAITSVDIRYHVFSMSSDTWTTTNETIKSGVSIIVGYFGLGLCVRSDGDVIVSYNGASSRVMGTDYARVYYARKEASWTVDVSLDNGGATDWVNLGAVAGASDRTHFIFQDDIANDGYQRTLTSANSLQSFPSSFDADMHTTGTFSIQGGASYVSGATTKVRYPYASSSVAEIDVMRLDSSDTPTPAVDSDVSGTINAAQSSFRVSMAANGTDLYLSFIDNSVDIYYTSNADGAGWATPTLFLTGSYSKTYINVYDRGGSTVLAFVYVDSTNSDVIYNEVTLAAGTTNAAFDMDAAATLTMAGRSTASSNLSSAAVASAAFNGRSTAATNLDADAAASVTWTGAEVIAATEADWSSTATAAVTWGGVGLYPAVFDFDAAAVLAMAGAGNAAAAWSSTTTATLTMAGAATGEATLSGDAAATLTLNGVAVSSAAWEATATASVTWVGVSLTLAASAWESTATAALTWAGEANASANWSAAAVASLTMASESDAAAAWSSDATASLVMVGSSDAASVWSATATANLTTAGSSVLSAAWEATAAASVTFNGQALATVNAAWNMAAAATLELVGASDAATDWSATAAASVTFNGEADAASVWAATAAASVTFNGAPVSSATWEADATASVTFVGEDGATTTTESDASFIAATSVTMAGEADAEGVFDCQATASATFTGVAIGAVAAVRHEGAKIKRLQREARQAQEEEDIMLLAAAFIQYLEQNHGNY